MVTIIDTDEKFERFEAHYDKSDQVLLIPIYEELDKNPVVNNLSLLYVGTPDSQFLLCFNHSETKSISEDYLSFLNDAGKTKFIVDKKRFVQYEDVENLIDVSLLHWFRTNDQLEFPTLPNYHFSFQYSAPKIKVSHIPVYQIAETCGESSEKAWKIIDDTSDLLDRNAFHRYNDRVINTFASIESNGLKIDGDLFNEVFKEKIERDFNEYVFTDYNLFTSTGRPSNANHSINFAALNPDERQMDPFVSRFDDGGLLLMDYDAFHLRLIGKLCGYDLPSESFHTYLGKKYFDKDEISDEEYDESKKISFQLLYGEDIEEARNLEYFDRTYNLKQKIWDIYKKCGYIQTPLFHRQIDGDHISSLNPGKAFSYLLQSFETEFNVRVIQRLLKLLESYKTELVLYTYDSLLFDFSKSDGRQLITKIRDEMERDQMKVKIYAGKNYGSLKRIKL